MSTDPTISAVAVEPDACPWPDGTVLRTTGDSDVFTWIFERVNGAWYEVGRGDRRDWAYVADFPNLVELMPAASVQANSESHPGDAADVEAPDCCERHYVQAARGWPRVGGCSVGVYHAYRMPASAINAAIPEGWTSIVELHRAYVEVLRQLEAADAYTVRLRTELIENAGAMQALRRQRDEAEIARDEARDEIGRLRKSRLLSVSVIFGHHKGAPRPFALQRTDRSLVAFGAEFPDGAVALRLANDGGWTIAPSGGADAFAKDGMEILWLSDELESLAVMEAQRDAALAELAENTSVIQALRRQRDEAEARIGVNIKSFLAGDDDA